MDKTPVQNNRQLAPGEPVSPLFLKHDRKKEQIKADGYHFYHKYVYFPLPIIVLVSLSKTIISIVELSLSGHQKSAVN